MVRWRFQFQPNSPLGIDAERKYLTHSFLMPIVTASRFRWLKRSISLCYVTFKTDLQGESRSGKRRASGIPLERERGSQTSN